MAAEDAINFKAIFASVPTPLLVLARDLTIVDMNDCYAQVVGRTRDDLVGKPLFEAFPGPDGNVRILRDSIQRVFASGEADFVPLIHYPIPAPREGPSDVRTGFRDSYWSCSHVPVTTPDGQVRYVLQNSQDVTELHRSNAANPVQAKADEQLGTSVLHRAERVQALNASLLAETAQLRNLFMRAPSFMCLLRGPEYRIELANSAFMHLVGDRKLSGLKFRDAIPEVQGQLYLDLLDKVFRTGEAFVGKQMRAEFERKPGQGVEEVFISFVFQPIRGENGQVLAIFIDGNDVTDHVRAERSQALLVRELHHRVRNTLATVQGVMNSTARTAETIEDYQWAFSGRISSLARTHSLLTEEIQQFVSFPHLLRQEIGIYAEGGADRIVLEGPDVELPSQLAVPLGMTIHELTTNAYRHGALSAPDGRVTVRWTLRPAKDKRILTCSWLETGGPPVRPPSRHGFGSMILSRVLTQQIGAKVDASYPPDGFELHAEIPLLLERVS